MAYFRTVEIIESEAGWGSKIEDMKYFTSDEKAKEYVEKYNKKYNPPCDSVPSWYMYAKYGNIVGVSGDRLATIVVDPVVPD